MRRVVSTFTLVVLFGPILAAMPVQAQLSRTFVSVGGSDGNNCDRLTPCRTFQTAHDKTNADGEITVLDSGGYGAVKITKSISIVNDGIGEAGILVSGGATGITINGGPATQVSLRGLTIQGIGFGGGTGLMFNSGSALTINNCVFSNHSGDGITIAPSASGTSNLSIVHSVAANNGRHGIGVIPTSNVILNVALDRVEAVRNGIDGVFIQGGLARGGTITATVSDSISASNGLNGFAAASADGHATASLLLVRSVAANNGNAGINADSSALATLRVGETGISGNPLAWRAFLGGVVQSFGDNYVVGNGDGDPAIPTIGRK